MIALKVGLLCIFAASVQAYGNYYIQNDPNCYDRDYGYKYQNLYDCSQYYTCLDENQSELGLCPRETLFNSKTQSCDTIDHVHCEVPKIIPDCKLAASGAVYSHADCTKYLICDNGDMEEVECDEGLAFDIKLKICNWADIKKCPGAFPAHP